MRGSISGEPSQPTFNRSLALPGFVDTGWFAFKESTMSRTRLPYAPEFRRRLVEQVQVGLRRENLVRSGDLS